jgi:hypothetical protein
MIFPTKWKGIGYSDTTAGKKTWSESLKSSDVRSDMYIVRNDTIYLHVYKIHILLCHSFTIIWLVGVLIKDARNGICNDKMVCGICLLVFF